MLQGNIAVVLLLVISLPYISLLNLLEPSLIIEGSSTIESIKDIPEPTRRLDINNAQTKFVPKFLIIKSNVAKCCQAGAEGGSWGYLCRAHPRFVTERYYLTHPFKVKFSKTRRNVQLELARTIEECAKNPAKARLYEQCCEKAQNRLYKRIGHKR